MSHKTRSFARPHEPLGIISIRTTRPNRLPKGRAIRAAFSLGSPAMDDPLAGSRAREPLPNIGRDWPGRVRIRYDKGEKEGALVADDRSTVNEETALLVIYDSHQQAEQALGALQASGLDMQKVSVIGRGFHHQESPVGYYTLGPDVKLGGAAGTAWEAFWGAVWGFLYSSGLFLVPGVGPVLAAGPVVGILAGAIGAVEDSHFSALDTALVHYGVPSENLATYERAVKSGHTVLVVHGSRDDVAKAHAVLTREGLSGSARDRYTIH